MSFPLTDNSDIILIIIDIKLQSGANDARSDDTSRLKTAVAEWLNARTHNSDESPEGTQMSMYLSSKQKDERGICNDVTGRLLCPIDYNWDDPVCVNHPVHLSS
jgi:hypothetical protein